MKGGYDLYGRYYSNANDALNAEMAQCNDIDNGLMRKELEQQSRTVHQQEAYTRELELRVSQLEDYIKSLKNEL
jgi:hypothetical protein